MKTTKKLPRQQLERFSTVFMQLGLVLVLFIVFISLEHETEKKIVVMNDPGTEIKQVYSFDRVPIYVKESIEDHKPKSSSKKVVINKGLEVVKNNESTTDVLFKPTDKEVTIATLKIKEDKEEELIDGNDDPTPFNFVNKVPVFAGCEGLSETETRKCFDKKMSRLIQRHFNSELASELGLQSGKHKIYTQFVIDKEGEVSDIKINAPHAVLKKETQRVVNKIPTFTPGKHNGKPVKVRYTLPITFQVE